MKVLNNVGKEKRNIEWNGTEWSRIERNEHDRKFGIRESHL